MVEAVRTTQSTFGIWVIVAVAMISLAVWLVGVYIADGYQTRLSRLQLRRRISAAPGPVLDDGGSTATTVPGQRQYTGQPAPEPEAEAEAVAAPRGRHHRPDQADSPPPARVPVDRLQTDFRRDGPLTKVETELQRSGPSRADVPAQADAPTRPDLPAQGASAQPAAGASAAGASAATGRHAMPAQRSGDADRAERSYAGPDADREDDEDQR